LVVLEHGLVLRKSILELLLYFMVVFSVIEVILEEINFWFILCFGVVSKSAIC
jgi:hypothetical protein